MGESDSGERLRAYLSLSIRAFASTAEDWADSSLLIFSSLGTISTIHRQKKADLGRKYHYQASICIFPSLQASVAASL